MLKSFVEKHYLIALVNFCEAKQTSIPYQTKL